MFWKTESFQHDVKSVANSVQSKCSIYIYPKSVSPLRSTSLEWDVEQEVKIPSKYFTNALDLCSYLNRGDKTKFSYQFGYDKMTNKFQVKVDGSTVLRISKTLSSSLGFDQEQFYNQKYIAPRKNTFNWNINHFYIYSNFIQPIQVGGKPVPLLSYIPIDAGEFGQMMHKEFQNKIYVPLNVYHLQHCEFGIYDDTGKLIDFIGGRTVLTLHFRKVK